MIHSASFLATGSDIAASAWVASAGLCLRTSSMTFSSASVSGCEGDEGDAMAAVAGAGAVTGMVLLAAVLAAGAVVLGDVLLAEVLLAEVLGTTLRAIG